jgi:hypothetical protein
MIGCCENGNDLHAFIISAEMLTSLAAIVFWTRIPETTSTSTVASSEYVIFWSQRFLWNVGSIYETTRHHKSDHLSFHTDPCRISAVTVVPIIVTDNNNLSSNNCVLLVVFRLSSRVEYAYTLFEITSLRFFRIIWLGIYFIFTNFFFWVSKHKCFALMTSFVLSNSCSNGQAMSVTHTTEFGSQIAGRSVYRLIDCWMAQRLQWPEDETTAIL